MVVEGKSQPSAWRARTAAFNDRLFAGSLLDLGDELGRVFFELRQAVVAAELHGDALVGDHVRFAHRAELFAGDDTHIEGIRGCGG